MMSQKKEFVLDMAMTENSLSSILYVVVPQLSPFWSASLTIAWGIDQDKLAWGRTYTKEIQSLCASLSEVRFRPYVTAK